MKRLALKYTAVIVGIVAFTAVVVGGGIYWSVQSELAYRLPDAADQAMSSGMILSHVNEGLVVTVPLLLVVVLGVSLVVWRKIAAPEYELGKILQGLAQGDFSVPMEPTRGKEMAEILRMCQDAQKKLATMVKEERQAVDQASVACGDLLRELEQGGSNKRRLQELAQGLLTHLEQLQVLASRYKLPTR